MIFGDFKQTNIQITNHSRQCRIEELIDLLVSHFVIVFTFRKLGQYPPPMLPGVSQLNQYRLVVSERSIERAKSIERED